MINNIEQLLSEYNLEPVIWLETHIELNTESKMFSNANNNDTNIPNTNIDALTTWQLWVLPVPNPEAIKKTVLLGRAIEASISEIITRDRKHYQYPDLPKGFQLTQLENPIVKWWIIACLREDWSIFKVPLEQIHLEEDAWKLIHKKDYSLADFNRAGRPLIEIVTKPSIHSIDDAIIYMEYLQKIVRFLKISHADMEKWHFRSDVSISLREKWTKDLNARTEIKNLNSFKFSKNAIIAEIEKQIEYFKIHKKIKQEQVTALRDEDKKEIRIMRKKENANDYRYINEPDIPAIDIKKLKESINVDLTHLPYQCEHKLIKWWLSIKEARYFSSNINQMDLFFEVEQEIKDIYFIGKFILNQLSSTNERNKKQKKQIIELMKIHKKLPIHAKIIKNCVKKIINNEDLNIVEYIKDNSMSENEIEIILEGIVKDHDEIVKQVKGDTKSIWLIISLIMKKAPKPFDWGRLKEIIMNRLGIVEEWSNKKLLKKTPIKADSDSTVDWIEHIINQSTHSKEEILWKYHSHDISQINESMIWKNISTSWRIESIRDHWDLIFIDIRHDNQIFQIKITREKIKELERISRLNKESVIMAVWVIQERDESTYNNKIKAWTIELDAEDIKLLSHSAQLPFEIKDTKKVWENTRLSYRFLDLRNKKNADNIRKRHQVVQHIREFLHKDSFTEVETPILSKGSDEWSREFIVPSRQHKWKFYVLPQAPQQFKQMLMASWIKRYYQIAKCFRDEDERWDRQAEFTQIDMELSFVSENEIRKLIWDMLISIIRNIYPNKKLLTPIIEEIKYKDAMEMYWCDKPDIRFWLKMKEITSIVKETEFKVFREEIEKWWIVKALKIDERISKSQIETLTKLAQSNWLWWLAYIIVNEDWLQSPIIKYLWEEICKKIIQKFDAQPWQMVFFAADKEDIANKSLDAVRRSLWDMLSLYNKNDLALCWIIDFPMFEKTVEGRRTFTHNPFSLPKTEHIKDLVSQKNIEKIIAQQYDIVLNWSEIWWWSIRSHQPSILESTYRVMGYSTQEIYDSIWHMLRAFCYGTPPHWWIALWLDRLMMILQNENSIREVMAFPKTGKGEDLLFNAPSDIPSNKISDVHIKKVE